MNYAAPNGKECCEIPTVPSSLLLSTAAGHWPWKAKGFAIFVSPCEIIDGIYYI